jgi:hypothetical protein
MYHKRRSSFTAFLAGVMQHRAYLIVFIRVVFAESPLREASFIHALTVFA